MLIAKRSWHPAVTLMVFVMAVVSAATENDLGVTVFLFAIALVNAAILLVQHRHSGRRRS